MVKNFFWELTNFSGSCKICLMSRMVFNYRAGKFLGVLKDTSKGLEKFSAELENIFGSCLIFGVVKNFFGS